MRGADVHQDRYPRHIVAVMGVARDGEGRVLLVRTQRGYWEPQGGQVELGEDLPEALEREFREESGCSVEIDRLVGVYSNVGTPEQVIFCFLCTVTGGELRGAGECVDAGWFEPEEALRLVEHPATRGRLSNALEGLLHVVYRAYRTRPAGDDYYGEYELLKQECY